MIHYSISPVASMAPGGPASDEPSKGPDQVL